MMLRVGLRNFFFRSGLRQYENGGAKTGGGGRGKTLVMTRTMSFVSDKFYVNKDFNDFLVDISNLSGMGG
jgi:hypothetical protein